MATEKTVTDKTTAEKKEIRKGPKIVGTVILILVSIAALCIGAWWGVNAIAFISTDDASIDGKQIKVSARILGRIKGIAVTEGQLVKEGETLVTLDATDLRAQEVQSNASLAYARQNLALVKISLDRAGEDASRIQKLFTSGATTREALDHSKNALESASAQFSLAQAQVETSVAQLGVIRAQLLNTALTAPISGTVDKITLVAGDVVQPGQAILSVNNLDSVWVNANLEETKISRIAPGASVRITIDAYPNRLFRGKVDMVRSGIVAPAFQIGEFTKTTQRIPVKIVFSDSVEGVKLLPGMSVEVKVRTTNYLPSFLVW